ncbi:MAG TPA: hypothetical protein VFS04_12310 [Alphaproteobacteria bacterium]|nr:hypothetical protein [Alphaproteobacteria bacterium]
MLSRLSLAACHALLTADAISLLSVGAPMLKPRSGISNQAYRRKEKCE